MVQQHLLHHQSLLHRFRLHLVPDIKAAFLSQCCHVGVAVIIIISSNDLVPWWSQITIGTSTSQRLSGRYLLQFHT